MTNDEAEMEPGSLDNEAEGGSDAPENADRQQLVERIAKTIRSDKSFHKCAFDQMRADMQFARTGAAQSWVDDRNYVANITGRHVRQKTNALYAKNPQVVARRRDRLEYQLWDGSPTSLQMAIQVMQMAGQATAMGAVLPPDQMAQIEQAQALVADFQQGHMREQMIKKFGKTLEVLFSQATRTQKPLDFKTAMKRTVRRAATTGVAYCELGFQRETGPHPATEAKLTDARVRLDHLRRLFEETQTEEKGEMGAEIAELELGMQSLMTEPEIVLREGLVIDFPQSTRVIPDRLCQSLVGFVGARHVTIEYAYTVNEVKEEFGVDLGTNYTPYNVDPVAEEQDSLDLDYTTEGGVQERKGDTLVCVWKHYDKPSGLVYYLVDGYKKDFIREPAAPDVFVNDFWPLYALTFNDVESEKDLFPPSDVKLIRCQQEELNRSRQALRQHRDAARPRWGARAGALNEETIQALSECTPFSTILHNADGALSDVLEPIPVPGVDPNLYEESPFFRDMQMTVGSAPARLGGIAKATATEAAIAEGSASADDASGIDDLDAFLTMIARGSGQILIREMTPDQVMKLVGPGAVWPGMTAGFELGREDLMDELWLEVEAGSTGKPNQAVEANNWKILAPIAMQIPGISPDWFARETIRRLDDRADLNEAMASGLPAMVAMNRNAQPMGQNPENDPAAQGDEGADNTSAPSQPAGTDAAFGSNQTDQL